MAARRDDGGGGGEGGGAGEGSWQADGAGAKGGAQLGRVRILLECANAKRQRGEGEIDA